jgi:hypothetical protein
MIFDYRTGDDIVAIKDHSQGVFFKGDVFTALAMQRGGCGCIILVDIGLKSDRPYTRCPVCEMNDEKTDNVWWVDARSFRRLLTKSQEEDLAEVLEEVLSEPLINTN